MKKLLIISIILIAFISLSAVSAQENTTDTLNTMQYPIIHSDTAKTFTDIQNSIDNANENDTIEHEGTYKSQGKEIVISKSITITAKDSVTIDGDKKSSIFNIKSGMCV